MAAPGERVWEDLVDLSAWPAWGPTVRSARLSDGGTRLHAGASGSVTTALGLHLPFTVERWRDEGPRREWSWRVAGVRATEHVVTDLGPATSRLQMGVPWWAPAYLGVVAVALARIRRRCEA